MKTADELFIVDNSDNDWKMRDYLREWTEIARAMDIATGYFEIGALLALEGQWQKLDKIRLLMGSEVTQRTRAAMLAALEESAKDILDASIENEKESNYFLEGVPAIVAAMKSGQIEARVYAKKKFHAKAYITHARSRVVGSVALVGSSNFTFPGLSDNIELNVQLRREVPQLQEWYETHWEDAENVSAQLLQTIERHIREYSPFQVYGRALRELMRNHIPDVEEWEKNGSKIYPLLARYQQEGYASLMQIAKRHGGAFLCDGVGLGKTFVGMMVVERLLHERKKVVLFSPKAAKEPVWGATLRKYLPHAFGAWGGLRLFSHTDIGRKGPIDGGGTWEELWEDVARQADAVIIDEAHHFRNPGTLGGEGREESRYRKLFRLCEGKQVYLLTATPVNNSLRDFQHMIELFSRAKGDFFARRLGIHSLPNYFGDMEKRLEREVRGIKSDQIELPLDVSEDEAEQVLRGDKVFRELVVQRSRTYARRLEVQEAKAQGKDGDHQKIFPRREDPHVAQYSIKKSYGKLLDMVEGAFDKDKPLFALSIYYPLFHAEEKEKARLLAADKRIENQQQQVVGLIRTNFLKRFESSTCAFETSCVRLFLKLFDWVEDYVHSDAEKKRFDRFRRDNEEVLKYLKTVLSDEGSGDEYDLLIPKATRPKTKAQKRTEAREKAQQLDSNPEMEDENGPLSRDKYKIDLILEDCFNDLAQIVAFLNELRKFKPSNDDKLRRLKELLKKELKGKKVLVFTEFADTAHYLQKQLEDAGFEGVDEIDSSTNNDRNGVIQKFAPYYNGLSSPELKAQGLTETQILISTDVLSEGLNLQDATRLVNYDLHWNPVRLMQRIGRVDRRMNPDIEKRIVADNPSLFAERGDNNVVAYWNFLPPEEMNELLTLYKRVTHKTLRISKTFGIEGKKLLTEKDDYDALRDFTHALEPKASTLEHLSLEWNELLAENADLPQQLDALPGRLFSGKARPKENSRAVFFCYVLPTKSEETGEWTHQGGPVRWLLFDLKTQKIADSPSDIAEFIRSTPATPRVVSGETVTLGQARVCVEKQLRSTLIKALGIPMGSINKPLLRCWMELS